MAQIDYYDKKPVDLELINEALRTFIDAVVAQYLRGDGADLTIQLLVKNFGPSETANTVFVLSQRDGSLYLDNTKLVSSAAGQFAIVEALTSALALIGLGGLTAASAPIAIEVLVLGGIAATSAYLYKTFASPVVDWLFNAASVRLEVTNENGDIAGGAVYRNGLQEVTPMKAVMDLISWSINNATIKASINAHIQFYDDKEPSGPGFDLLASDVLAQIAQDLGKPRSDIENRTDGRDVSGGASKNVDLLAQYLAPNSAQYSILQTGAQIGLHMYDKDAGVDRQFSRDSLYFAGQVRGIEFDSSYIAAFGTDQNDKLDLGGALHTVYAYGGAGVDVIVGGQGDDFLWGDVGNDQMNGSADQINGGAGDDQIFGGGGGDQLSGQDGNDEIRGGWGEDKIDGGDDNDVIFGGMDKDVIHGGSGDDKIYAGSDVPGENDSSVNELYGDAGKDVVIGSLGDDVLSGGAGDDYVDGGLGIDTASFEDAVAKQKIVISAGGAPPDGVAASGAGDFLTVKRASETDVLHSIEKITLSDQADELIIEPGVDLTKIKEIDAGSNPGGAFDILDLSNYGSQLEVRDGHLIGNGIDIKLDGFEVVKKPTKWFGNDYGDDLLTTGSIKTVYMGDGEDDVTITGAGITVDLGAGDDTLESAGPGTIIKTGDGKDKIEISHNGQLLIQDASTDDRITSYDHVLTGAVRWGGSESAYAYDIYGNKYGRNKAGDLIIIDGEGNETFIPHFNFGLTGGETAGLFVIEVTYKIIRSNMWTAGFETAVSEVLAMEKIGQALFGWPQTGRKDPLVLDLDGNGISFTIQEASNAMFDIDKDGFAEPVGWIGGNDGFLVRDRNGNGVIDDVGEMFGNAESTGFAQLALLDGNHDGKVSVLDNGLADFNGDGVVDASDTFASLKVWVDANENGITNAGELKSLADYNIVSISTASTPSGVTDGADTISDIGSFERADGTTGTAADVQLETDNSNTKWLGDSTVSAAAASRANLKGFGTLADLHVAMTLSPGLASVVDTAMPSLSSLSMAALRDAARPILYAWTQAVPVPAGTPGTEQTEDFHFVGTTNEKGAIVYDFLVKKMDSQGAYYGYASGQKVYDANHTIIDRPTLQQVLDSTPEHGSWNILTAADIAFLERFTGQRIGFGIPDAASSDAISRVAGAVTAGWNVMNREAIRLAAQGPLSSFFAGIAYDAATDTFKPTTDQQFAPMLEQIFQHTPASPTDAATYIAYWKDIIGMVLPDFQRDDQGRLITDAYLFANIVNAYENVPVVLSLQAVAEKLFDIPASELFIGNGNLTGGDTTNDIFYLNGSDQLVQGQGGQDAYVVGYDFGHDVIHDVWQGLGDSQEDAIWFAHLNVDDLTFARDGVDLLITQNGTDNQIRVVDEFVGRRPGLVTAYQDLDTAVEVIKFADGTTWDKYDIAQAVGKNLHPTTDGKMIGTGDVDYLYAGGGVTFMSGGNLGDQYFYGRGDGHVTVEDQESWIWGENLDFLNFGAGITLDDLTFEHVGNTNDLRITINGTDDVLTVAGQFQVIYGLLPTMVDRIEYFTFADGRHIGWEDIIKSLDAGAGTDGNDTIYGFSYADTLSGGRGDDIIDGGALDDTYVYMRGDGHDTISDGPDAQASAFDTLVLKGIAPTAVSLVRNGNDVSLIFAESAAGAGDGGSVLLKDELDVFFSRGIEQVTFDDGTVWTQDELRLMLLARSSTAGNDVITGYNTNDVIEGGRGDDVLAGGAGDDTYIYNRGDGNDVITEVTAGNYSTYDTLRLKGVTPASIAFTRSGNDLTLVIGESTLTAGDGGSITLKDELADWFGQGVEQIVFDDGTVWDQNYLRTTALSQASTPGDDIINGFNTNDILIGGRGNDTLSGGAGDDTYIYNRGDGNDTIIEGTSGNFSTFDTLRLLGINPSAISLVRSGTDLTLVIAESAPGAGDGGSILIKQTLDNFFSSGVEQIVFDDGTLWTQDDLRLKVLAQYSTSGNDVIDGFNTNDVITGGRGNDTMSGGAGDDTYIYNRGDGNDTIIEGTSGNFSTYDTLRLHGVNPAAIGFLRNGNDVTLVIAESAPGAGDGGSILINQTLEDFFSQGVEQIVFDDGTVWTQADLRAFALQQQTASGASSIIGFNGADTIAAGTGDRYLNGGGGADTYVYSSAGGNVVIEDSTSGNALLLQDIASTGVVLSRPGNGADLLIQNSLTGKVVTVKGQFSNGLLSTITFGDGVRWSQAQILDVLAGSEDSAAYLFNPGSGQVTVANTVTTIKMGAGVSASDLYFQANGSGDLVIRFKSSGDTITIAHDLAAQAWGVASAVIRLKFVDGTLMPLGQPTAGQGTPITFSWYGATGVTTLTGANFGTNVFDLAPGGDAVTFGNSSQGGNGQNSIKYEKGDGSANVNLNGGTGVIALGAGITAEDVYLQANGYGDLSVNIRNDATDYIFIHNDLTSNAGTVTSGVRQLQFADGSVVDLGQGSPLTFKWLGTGNNYNLTGATFGSNMFDISAGSGTINFANNTGIGGTNTIKYIKGDGGANVYLNGGTGVIALGAGITAQDVYLQANGYGDLSVNIRNDAVDYIFIHNDLTSNAGTVTSGVSQLQFADGSVIDLNQGSPLTFTWFGNDNYNLTGTTFGNNVYDITAGSGTINFANNAGAGGTNTIKYIKGDGRANVNLNGGTGRIAFGADIAAQDVYFQFAGQGDLVIKFVGDDTDVIDVGRALVQNTWGLSSAISELTFADGTSMTVGQPTAGSGTPLTFTWFGTANNTTLTGGNGVANHFVAGPGSDRINFGNTTNIIDYVKGDGNVTVGLNGGTGTIDFGAGITAQDVYLQFAGPGDMVVKFVGDDADSIQIGRAYIQNAWGVSSAIGRLTFADGTSMTVGQPAAGQGTPLTFTWYGTAANKTLTGGNGVANHFIAGPGGDQINFGNASNTIDYEKGDGNVTVSLNGGTGSINFGPGITAQDVYMQFAGSGDMVVKLVGDSADSIQIGRAYVQNAWGVSSAVGQLNFADGTSMTVGQSAPGQGIPLTFTWYGTPNSAISGGNGVANTFVVGAGTESFTGGDANNKFIASKVSGQATITAHATSGSINELDFKDGISQENLWFMRSGNDLKIEILGTSTLVDVNGWFSDSSHQLQEVTAGGLEIDSQVSQLVQAMATYSANNPGFDPAYPGNQIAPADSALQSAIAAAWHA